jgi:peptide subunit release factor 1 (eRF1)
MKEKDLLIELIQQTNRKTGEVSYGATVLTYVLDFGTVRRRTVDVALTAEQYSQLIGKEGQPFPLRLVPPRSEYRFAAL